MNFIGSNYIEILIIALILVIFILIYLKIIKDKKQINELDKANKALKMINLSFEANHLKFLLQPHTLNNVLSNLKVFSNKLNKGMDSLSEILEYIFYKGENHFVSIADEVIFIRKYMA